jgi:hypothetical protein
MKIVSKGSYEKNTEDVGKAVEDIARGVPQAVIMIGVVRPAAAFVKAYQTAHPGTQLFSISVVNGRELHQLAGGDAARGVGITQVMPSPSAASPASPATTTRPSNASPPKTPVLHQLRRIRRRPRPDRSHPPHQGHPHPGGGDAVAGEPGSGPGGIQGALQPGERVGSRYVEVTLLGRDGNHVR